MASLAVEEGGFCLCFCNQRVGEGSLTEVKASPPGV